MKDSAIDIILHPVRMRIIQHLINQKLTAQDLKERLPDIPQASLYRNLKKLLEAGVIHVVDEKPIRGTVEKVYSILDQPFLSPDDLNKMSKNEHMELFIKFFANLLGEYERYLSHGDIDLLSDGVSFRQASIYLSDEEFTDFTQDLVKVYQKVGQNKPAKGRRRRTIATILIPDKSLE
ncbi:helix-turn-helix domain-containing protein [Neobacillus endophyticus]|uniref:helix-turn-helix domain-containing protein n=1 Tax=Neobacillus endophyticus TaxID=2738405 RepID=UPI001C26350E|nr:helix-turn-helix domain-containing protein [Neobacillus endophyticus]